MEKGSRKVDATTKTGSKSPFFYGLIKIDSKTSPQPGIGLFVIERGRFLRMEIVSDRAALMFGHFRRTPAMTTHGHIFTLLCCGSLGCMNEYLAIDSGEHLYTNSLRALMAVWLNASQ